MAIRRCSRCVCGGGRCGQAQPLASGHPPPHNPSQSLFFFLNPSTWKGSLSRIARVRVRVCVSVFVSPSTQETVGVRAECLRNFVAKVLGSYKKARRHAIAQCRSRYTSYKVGSVAA